jgi:hypothetical protein
MSEVTSDDTETKTTLSECELYNVVFQHPVALSQVFFTNNKATYVWLSGQV